MKLLVVRVAVAASVLLVAVLSVRAAAGAGSVRWELHYPRWSPDGRSLAYVVTQVPAAAATFDDPFANPRGRARIWLVDADGTHAHPLTPRQFAVENLAWSPDGSALTYNAGGHIWRYDLSSGQLTQLTFGHYDDAWWPAWSPDGSMIAYTQRHRADTRIEVVPAVGGTPRLVTYGRERPQWSPDGKRLLLQRDPVFVNLDGSGITLAGDCEPRGWSADGTLLVGLLSVCDAQTGQLVYSWKPNARVTPTGSTLSADNRVLAFTGGWSAHVFLLPRNDVLRRLPDSDSYAERASWSRSGLIAYIARSSCGRHSAIRVADENGNHVRTLVKSCAS